MSTLGSGTIRPLELPREQEYECAECATEMSEDDLRCSLCGTEQETATKAECECSSVATHIYEESDVNFVKLVCADWPACVGQ